MQEQNIAENSNSSEILNVQKDIISPLSKIFYSSPQDQSTLLPIIKCIDELPHLFYILRKPLSSSEENKKINFKEKFEIFQKLMTLFKQNTNLINLFTERYKTNFTNFYEPIIELYLDEENASDEIKSSLEEILIFLINKVSIPKFIMEKIYQKLSIYLRYNTYKEKIPKMSQNVFMRYLNLLEIFYTNSLENNGFKCPYCAKKIKLGEDLNDIIRAYNNLKETINGIKLMLENIIKTSVNNPMNSQLKIVNITLNSINEDIQKNNQKLEKILNNNNTNEQKCYLYKRTKRRRNDRIR